MVQSALRACLATMYPNSSVRKYKGILLFGVWRHHIVRYLEVQNTQKLGVSKADPPPLVFKIFYMGIEEMFAKCAL